MTDNYITFRLYVPIGIMTLLIVMLFFPQAPCAYVGEYIRRNYCRQEDLKYSLYGNLSFDKRNYVR